MRAARRPHSARIRTKRTKWRWSIRDHAAFRISRIRYEHHPRGLAEINRSSHTTTPSRMSGTAAATAAASCRFAHYFVVCGVDADTGLEPDDGAGRRSPQTQRNTSTLQESNMCVTFNIELIEGLFVPFKCVLIGRHIFFPLSQGC